MSLAKLLQPGSTVYTIVRKYHRSGLPSVIAFLVVEAGKIRNISGTICDELGLDEKWADSDGLYCTYPFNVIRDLSYKLHGKESVGRKAKACTKSGVTVTPNLKTYNAGYSLIHQAL